MATEQKTKLEIHHDRLGPMPAKDIKSFSGKVLTLVYAPHPAGFKDYKVVRLTVEKNQVTNIEYLKNGTHYSRREALLWLETCSEYWMDDMDRRYPKDEKGEEYRVA